MKSKVIVDSTKSPVTGEATLKKIVSGEYQSCVCISFDDDDYFIILASDKEKRVGMIIDSGDALDVVVFSGTIEITQ